MQVMQVMRFTSLLCKGLEATIPQKDESPLTTVMSIMFGVILAHTGMVALA
jgi:hypothetical protein